MPSLGIEAETPAARARRRIPTLLDRGKSQRIRDREGPGNRAARQLGRTMPVCPRIARLKPDRTWPAMRAWIMED